jgi:hypothetical protein
MVQAWLAHFVTLLNIGPTSPTNESLVKNHTKSTNDLTNSITMVLELLAPPAAWTWWTPPGSCTSYASPGSPLRLPREKSEGSHESEQRKCSVAAPVREFTYMRPLMVGSLRVSPYWGFHMFALISTEYLWYFNRWGGGLFYVGIPHSTWRWHALEDLRAITHCVVKKSDDYRQLSLTSPATGFKFKQVTPFWLLIGICFPPILWHMI